MNIVRKNLMTRPGYTPYCGSDDCGLVRTEWDGQQFKCYSCGWRSKYPDQFIKKYKAKWNK